MTLISHPLGENEKPTPKLPEKVAILGAGSFGLALAVALSSHSSRAVSLWGRNTASMHEMERTRTSSRYLAGLSLPPTITCESSLASALLNASYVFFAIPTPHLRSVAEESANLIMPSSSIISGTKGIEKGSLCLPSQILSESLQAGKHFFYALGGPAHAEELAYGQPTTLVIAGSQDGSSPARLAQIFSSQHVRFYGNDDLIGVEYASALKNVIALATGMASGLGLGDNAIAAVVTRGLAEITRLGLKAGAHASTFMGLSGVGDLVGTCLSTHSRNRRAGELMAQGFRAEEVEKKIGMAAEGISTVQATYDLIKIHNVSMPITEHVWGVIKGKLSAEQAVKDLLSRNIKSEERWHP